jgi:uncharacterized membrane protein
VFEPTPGAAFSFEPQNPDKGEQIEFNASASSSPGTVIDTYEWDFGDGTVTTTSSETITHSYSAYDSYNVSLTVTDGNNRTSTTGDVVSVIDAGPAVFSVTTNATNAPITEGEDLRVDVDVNNTGGSTGTQNITLQRDSTGDGTADTQVDTQEVTNLGPADGIRSITLEWGTQVGDDGENISINVTSEDDFDQGQVTVNQSQAGSITIQGDVTSAGGSGKVEFNLNNTGDINATLVALGINETTSTDATEVDKGVNLTAGGSQIISQLIDFDSSTPGQAQRYDFSSNVTLQPGESETFEFDKFRATNGNADMRGEDITTTLWLDDGSTATITLQVSSSGGSGNNG